MIREEYMLEETKIIICDDYIPKDEEEQKRRKEQIIELAKIIFLEQEKAGLNY